MDLSTQYLGLTLKHPLMLGASPLVDDLDAVRRCEDAGAAAIVMHSLFEEQLAPTARMPSAPIHEPPFADGSFFRTEPSAFALGPDEYLEQVRRIKAAVQLPVIASLNGFSDGEWLKYARLVDQAGADALELNVYRVAIDPVHDAERVERETIAMLYSAKSHTTLPVAVKLSPYYTALSHFAARLVAAGADGLVLFSRFYQPDIDLERRQVVHQLELSSSTDLLLRLRWLAILSAQVDRTLSVSGGVHSAPDALKTVMAGAHGVQLVSEILKRGPRRFGEILNLMQLWLEAHGYSSLQQVRGTMNLSHCPDPPAYERASHLQILNACSREYATNTNTNTNLDSARLR